MSISIPSRVVVFDYGEVISVEPTPEDRAVLLGLAGVDPERFWRPYWAYRTDLDRGTLTTDAYWSTLARELGADWDAGRRQELWVADYRSWISVEPGTASLLDELRRGGTRIALLSNAGPDFGGPLRFSPMGSWFERVFVSGELDLVKPDAAIYETVARELGITPAEMVFIDNKRENVEGAEAIGVTGHVFTGVAELRDFLVGLAA